MSSKTTPDKTNWVCSDESCANINYPKRDKCNKCGLKRKEVTKPIGEIGKVVAEKSKGLFSANDWMCKSCGNINWARRNTCNICNTNKVNTQGERTGYGGGFMERDEVVEYKKYDDDEDEYDEFGKLKKKFRGPNCDPKEVNPNSNDETVDKTDSEEEEEEEDGIEEDDDEDADMSKYDLWGDDVEATKALKTSDAKPPRSHSNSASSSSSGSSSDSSDSSNSDASSASDRKPSEREKNDRKSKNRDRSRFDSRAFLRALLFRSLT